MAFKAANAKDAKALEDIGNDIADVCETCHAKYLPKPAPQLEPAPLRWTYASPTWET